MAEVEARIAHPTGLALNLPSCSILATDSRVCGWGNIVTNSYDKLIEIHPNVFLVCFGSLTVIDPLLEALADLPNCRSMGEIALFVQNTLNTVIQEHPLQDDGVADRYNSKEPRFVLLGRVPNEMRHYFFTISKGKNTWMYFAKREVGNVVFAGAPFVERYLNENKFDENMSEEEAVEFAFRCLEHCCKRYCYCGGRIQVVVMKPCGSSIVHSWLPRDLHDGKRYVYQGTKTKDGWSKEGKKEENRKTRRKRT